MKHIENPPTTPHLVKYAGKIEQQSQNAMHNSPAINTYLAKLDATSVLDYFAAIIYSSV